LIAVSLAVLVVGCDHEGSSIWGEIRTPSPGATSPSTQTPGGRTPALPTATAKRDAKTPAPPGTPTPSSLDLGLEARRAIAPKIVHGDEDLTGFGLDQAYTPSGWLDPGTDCLVLNFAHGEDCLPQPVTNQLESAFGVYGHRTQAVNGVPEVDTHVLFFTSETAAHEFLRTESEGDWVVESHFDTLPPGEAVQESLSLYAEVSGRSEYGEYLNKSVYFRYKTLVVVTNLVAFGSGAGQLAERLEAVALASADRLKRMLGEPDDTPAPTLRQGVQAEVFGSGTCLNARKTPSKSAEIVKCLVDGTTVYIDGGPVDAEGYRWWKLRDLGWAAENWLRPKP
jgi:hypothetical protein